jgi:hypothetical protein
MAPKAFYLTLPLLATVTASSLKCIDFTVPINITAPSYDFTFPPFQNHFVAVAQMLDITVRNAPNGM